jgi:hypothetical protein
MRKTLLTGSLFLILAGAASAGPLVLVTVNTGAMGLNGDSGSIDFMLSQPSGAQASTVQILNFTGATYINSSQSDTGSVTGGPVPSTITINSSNPESDDFEAVTFSNTLSFDVLFSGPAVDSPNGTALSFDGFNLFLYSDQPGSTPANLTDPTSGNAGAINVNVDGTVTSVPFNSADFSAQVVPEPSTLGMMFGALMMLIGGLVIRRRKATV